MVWDKLESIEGEAQWKWWAWWACQSRTKLQFEQIHSAIQTISFWIKLDKYILKMRQIGKCWRNGTMKVMGLVLLPTDFTQNSAFWEGSCCQKKRRLLLSLRHRLWLKTFLLQEARPQSDEICHSSISMISPQKISSVSIWHSQDFTTLCADPTMSWTGSQKLGRRASRQIRSVWKCLGRVNCTVLRKYFV